MRRRRLRLRFLRRRLLPAPDHVLLRLEARRIAAQVRVHTLGATALAAPAADQPTLRRVAAEHAVCPYWLSHEVARWADVVVGDCNYYFDPHAMLYALSRAQEWRVAVLVDETVQVPMEYVKNGEIVLNVSYDATSGLRLGNDYIEFKARFAGVPRDILVPIKRVLAIYARENGQGMAFEVRREDQPDRKKKSESKKSLLSKPDEPVASSGTPVLSSVNTTESAGDDGNPDPEPPKTRGKPKLTRVK